MIEDIIERIVCPEINSFTCKLEIKKYDKPETGSQYYYRNSSNNSKNEKPKTTETKTNCYVLTGKTNSSSYYEEQ